MSILYERHSPATDMVESTSWTLATDPDSNDDRGDRAMELGPIREFKHNVLDIMHFSG